jgi:hypothetical protein
MLKNLPHHLALLSAALWVGGMWAVGYLAVPVLFQTLPDRQLAGLLAGKMFTVMAYVGIGCAIYLSAYQFRQFGSFFWKQKTVWAITAMLLLVLIGQFGIQPAMAELKVQALPLEVMQSAQAGQFKALHGIASILYLLQSLLGLALLIRLPDLKNN